MDSDTVTVDILVNKLSNLVNKLGANNLRLIVIKDYYNRLRKDFNSTNLVLLYDHIESLTRILEREELIERLPNFFEDKK
jgi:hypothetical protein